MTKSELVDRLCRSRASQPGASQSGAMSLVRAELIVNAIFDSIESALAKGERTEIRGFGSFEVRSYGQYTGRNPRSGSTVVVKAKRLPFFKAGKELKDRINEAAQLKFAQRRGPLSAPNPVAAPAAGATAVAVKSAATRTEAGPADDFAARAAIGR